MNPADETQGGQSKARRIVVEDLPPAPASKMIRGRRLEDPRPHAAVAQAPQKPEHRPRKAPRIGRVYQLLGVAALLVLVLIAGIAIVLRQAGTRRPARLPERVEENIPNTQASLSSESDELHQIEVAAKEVIRRISRDNKPYSFNERTILDIQTRVRRHSRSAYLSRALSEIQQNGQLLSVKAEKEGLSVNLVALVALSLTDGGQNGDPVNAAGRALPSLAVLSKMFGSDEADSCLILIAAFQEGAGTKRSHPLLRRMNKVVSNPLTERNIWYLHDQHVVGDEAYDLVVNTIAYGVLARLPRQFGLDNNPLNL